MSATKGIEPIAKQIGAQHVAAKLSASPLISFLLSQQQRENRTKQQVNIN